MADRQIGEHSFNGAMFRNLFYSPACDEVWEMFKPGMNNKLEHNILSIAILRINVISALPSNLYCKRFISQKTRLFFIFDEQYSYPYSL